MPSSSASATSKRLRRMSTGTPRFAWAWTNCSIVMARDAFSSSTGAVAPLLEWSLKNPTQTATQRHWASSSGRAQRIINVRRALIPVTPLRENLLHDFARDIGEPEIAALEAIGEPLVIDAE